MKRLMVRLLLMFGIAFGCASAQYVTVSSHNLKDASGNPVANATISFQPTDGSAHPISFRVGSSAGTAVTSPVTATVSAGAFTVQLADTSLTNPANVCYVVTVTDNFSGQSLLGPGYSCVQPTSASGSSWCTTSAGATTCNLDTYTPNLAAVSLVTAGPQGPQGAPGCISGSGCSGVIAESPTASQTVSQPPGTTLSVSSLNSVAYVNPTSSVDLVTQANALFANCTNDCEVHIPAGNYTVSSGSILMHASGTKLVGDGKNLVKITYSGTGPFIDQRNSGSDYDTNYDQGGEITGFTVTCTNPALTACIAAGSVLADHVHDITVIGPGGIISAGTNAGDGLQLQNTYNWMERANFYHINLGGFTNNVHFKGPTGTGTNSYGYGSWDFSMNVGAGTHGILVDSGAAVYNTRGVTLNVNNYNGTGADSILAINGSFTGANFHETGEGPTITLGAVSGAFLFSGDVFSFSGNGFTGSGQWCLGPYCTGSPQGSNYSSSGTIANFGGSTETVNVYTDESLSGPLFYAPASIAGHSWVVGTTPTSTGALPTSHLFTHDTGLPLCIGTLSGNSSGQSQIGVAVQQCFSGDSFNSPEAQIGDIHIGLYGVSINSGSVNAPGITQTTASTYGAYNEFDAQQGNWWWGVESNFHPHPGYYYFAPKGSFSATPPLEVSPSGGIISPSVSAGSGGFTETLTTPASSSATCAPGQFTDDANYHYVCVAANTWKRVALTAF